MAVAYEGTLQSSSISCESICSGVDGPELEFALATRDSGGDESGISKLWLAMVVIDAFSLWWCNTASCREEKAPGRTVATASAFAPLSAKLSSEFPVGWLPEGAFASDDGADVCMPAVVAVTSTSSNSGSSMCSP